MRRAMLPPAAEAARASPVHMPAVPSLGNQARLRQMHRPVVAAYKIGAVDDPLEHAAERAADRVMRMPEPGLKFAAAPLQISRACDKCEAPNETLRLKPAGPAPAQAPDTVRQTLSTPGRALDAAAQAFFAPRFGRDLSSIRIHDDSQAAASARDVGARAYTVGEHIAFATGQYAQGPSGQRLLAHEIAHVLQQQNGVTGLWRMAQCPDHLLDSDPTPAGWRAYHGDASVFHCGFRSILEARAGTPEDPENECVYDHSGAIVDEHHKYSGCRGTPDQYDSADHPILHTLIDSGGIVMAGLPAFITSRVHDLDHAVAVAIQAVEGAAEAGQIMKSLADRVGDAIAASVYTAIAVCDQTNWQITGLPVRSARHLKVVSGILTSIGWAGGDINIVLGNLTKRLDDLPIAGLLGEIAEDINTGLDARQANIHTDMETIGRLTFFTLIDWLQSQGLIQYIRPPEIIGQEKFRAAKGATAAPR